MKIICYIITIEIEVLLYNQHNDQCEFHNEKY